MAKPKKKGSTGRLAKRFRSQVQAESTLRFNPERSTVKRQIRDVDAERDTAIKAAAGTAVGIRAAADAARPQVEQHIATARKGLDDAVADARKGLEGLSAAAEPYRGGVERDAANTRGRLGEIMSQAAIELESRKADAVNGAAYAAGAARSRAAGEKGRLRDRLTNIAKESGAFAQGRTGELVEADRGRRHDSNESKRTRQHTSSEKAKDRANARLTSGVDKNGKVIPNGKADKPTGVNGSKTPRVSSEGHANARESLASARRIVESLRKSDAKRQKEGKAPRGRNGIVQAVAGGIPATEGTSTIDPAKYKAAKDSGMSDGAAKELATTKAPGFKGTDPVDGVLARAAADVAYDGFVSRKTAKALQEAGYSVKALGLPSYSSVSESTRETSRRRRNPGRGKKTRVPASRSAPGARGQSRPG